MAKKQNTTKNNSKKAGRDLQKAALYRARHKIVKWTAKAGKKSGGEHKSIPTRTSIVDQCEWGKRSDPFYYNNCQTAEDGSDVFRFF